MFSFVGQHRGLKGKTYFPIPNAIKYVGIERWNLFELMNSFNVWVTPSYGKQNTLKQIFNVK